MPPVIREPVPLPLLDASVEAAAPQVNSQAQVPVGQGEVEVVLAVAWKVKG